MLKIDRHLRSKVNVADIFKRRKRFQFFFPENMTAAFIRFLCVFLFVYLGCLHPEAFLEAFYKRSVIGKIGIL